MIDGFRVVDNEYNRMVCPERIGDILDVDDIPPSVFTERMFPVLLTPQERREGKLAWIPWSAVVEWEGQIIRNHGQDLERLAQRGGLSPFELFLACRGYSLSAAESMGLSQERLFVWLETLARPTPVSSSVCSGL